MTESLFSKEELEHLYWAKELSTREIAEIKGCHYSTVQRYMKLYCISCRSLSESMTRYPRHSFSGDRVEQAYLQGFSAGDLYVHKTYDTPGAQTIVVNCASGVQAQIDLIRSLFEPYGRVHISREPSQSAINCYLDMSFAFLLHQEDCIEAWILSNPCYFVPFLAGYIDAEGCIQVKRATNAAEVVIRSYDVNILRQSYAVLQKLDVICPPVNLVKRKGSRDAGGPIYHQDYWRLGVYRKLSIHRLFTLVDPYMKHARRRRDMMVAWENVKSRLKGED